jgi:hypothetical protein
VRDHVPNSQVVVDMFLAKEEFATTLGGICGDRQLGIAILRG